MATKLKNLSLDELSLVDVPANSQARVSIFKQATKTEDGKEFPASDFAYVPDPEKPSTWKLRLTSEPGGDPDPRIVGAAAAALGPGFRGNRVELPTDDREAVISRVRAAWRKANPDKEIDDMPEVLQKNDQLVDTITKIGHTFTEHMRREEFDREAWDLMDALRQSMRDAVAVGSRDMMRQSVMEFVETMREKFPNVEAQLQKGVDMSIEELQEKLEKAEALASMSDAEKEFMKSLDANGQEAFMKSKPEERVEAMKVAKAADESITVNGHEVKKSAVGAGMFEIIKSQQAELQAQKDAIAKSNEQLEMERLTKRASDEFGHLPGKPEEIAAVLKHVGSMPEDVQGTMNAILKAANESTSGAFVSKGHSGANTPVHNNATEKLDDLAKKYAEDYKVDYPTAYDAVITKHADLYEESINEGH